MKKLILILLLIPLVGFGQSQIVNGIEVSAPKEYVKTGNLTWSKGNNTFIVQSVDIILNPDEIAKNTYPDLKFLRTDEFELNGKQYKIGFNSANKGSQLIGMMAIVKEKYSFLIAATVFSNEFKGTAKEKATAMYSEIYYLMSYSAGKFDFKNELLNQKKANKYSDWYRVNNKFENISDDPFTPDIIIDSSYAYTFGKLKTMNIIDTSIKPKLMVNKKGLVILSVPLELERNFILDKYGWGKVAGKKYNDLLKKNPKKIISQLKEKLNKQDDDGIRFELKIAFDGKTENTVLIKIPQKIKESLLNKKPLIINLEFDKGYDFIKKLKSKPKILIKLSLLGEVDKTIFYTERLDYMLDGKNFWSTAVRPAFIYSLKNYDSNSYYEFSLSGSSKALDFN